MTTGSSPEPDGAQGVPAPGSLLPEATLPEGAPLAGAGEPEMVDLVAAALRADSADLDSYHRVLSTTLAELLPPGMVAVERDRSMKERLAGQPGRATSIRVQLGDRMLELTAAKGRIQGAVARSVRGVVISRQEVTVAEWTRQLAQYLAQAAAESAAARASLARLLESG